MEVDPESGRLALDDLSLSGTLGHLHAAARGDATNLAAELDFELTPPEILFPETLPAELRPTSVSGEAHARADTLSARVTVAGLSLGTRPDVRLELDAAGPLTAPDLRAYLLAERDTLAHAAAAVPDPADPEASLDATLTLIGLPLPTVTAASHPEQEVRLDGHLHLGGTLRAPTGDMDLAATLPAWEDLAAHRLEIRASLGAGTDTSRAGVRAVLALKNDGAVLARGRLVLPGEASFAPAGFMMPPDGALDAHLEADDLHLDAFTPLLPAAVGLQGVLDLDLDATGDLRDPALAGRLALADGRATLPDGSWIALRGTSALAGSLTRPDVSGDLEITSGVLRLPDPPKALHPATGRALLWDVTPAPEDTTTTVAAAPAPPAILPTANVRVSIPAGLWLRGQGLEIELAGDLEVRSAGEALPDVIGDLEARSGYYRFLGRTFTVERGGVDFDGEDVLDPALDFALTTRLDGADYDIAFGGTLQRPTLTLSSEPELPEGDIMAVLLFGRPLDELSGDQENVVRDRATDLVTAFGTAQLEARLARQLKVDMVTLRRGGGAEGADALVIGKYLHQKVLLKYEQVLDEWAAFVVNLEYFLSRRFKLETMISRQAQSAATLDWSLDY